jgi:hypothetical protein
MQRKKGGTPIAFVFPDAGITDRAEHRREPPSAAPFPD